METKRLVMPSKTASFAVPRNNEELRFYLDEMLERFESPDEKEDFLMQLQDDLESYFKNLYEEHPEIYGN